MICGGSIPIREFEGPQAGGRLLTLANTRGKNCDLSPKEPGPECLKYQTARKALRGLLVRSPR